MTDYFEHVERELSVAVRRRAHLPWYLRLRSRNSRALTVLLAALVVAGPAVAAVALLQSGSAVKPEGPLTPRAFNGVALRSGGQLLSLRVPDPTNGPPWGLKLIRTTRGLLCVQVGRVAFGTVGALGQDGAFGNDGKFHPFSLNYQSGPPCVTPDARGNGFLNMAIYSVPANGLSGDNAAECRQPLCKAADLRDVYYGLLGPEAIGITYQTANGGLATETTAGSDGAYLIVRRAQGQSGHPGVSFGGGGGYTYDASLFPGAVRSVRYRDGHVCHVAAPSRHGRGSCPVIGYAQPATPLPTPAQVASKITARIEPSRSYCTAPPPSEVVIPCANRIPRGFSRLDMSHGPAQVLAVISFVSKLPITNGHSYYYIQMTRAPYTDPRYARGGNGEACGPQNGDFGQTNADYRRGQIVEQYFFENLGCRGPVHGDISLVITRGPASPAPMGAAPGLSIGREVGRFSFNVP